MRLAFALLFAASSALAQQDPFPLPPKEWPRPVMDSERFSMLLLDRFEYRWRNGDDTRNWDAQAWFGGDYNKLWLKSEGEWAGGDAEEADIEVLYARRITPFWHLQAGVRHEARPRPSREQGVLALQGLAPYWFNVEASAFLGGGNIYGRFEAEYDQLLTQRLILQPRVETNIAGSADEARGIGRGINNVELGLRLRCELRRELAPYIGLSWNRRVGDTADLARAAAAEVTERSVVIGLRAWY